MTPEEQAPILEIIRTMLYWTATWSAGMMLLVQYGMYRAAHGESSVAYGLIAMLFGVLVTPFLSLAFLTKIQAHINAVKKGANRKIP